MSIGSIIAAIIGFLGKLLFRPKKKTTVAEDIFLDQREEAKKHAKKLKELEDELSRLEKEAQLALDKWDSIIQEKPQRPNWARRCADAHGNFNWLCSTIREKAAEIDRHKSHRHA